MDALLQTVTQTVAHDVRGLVHATELQAPSLIEKEPPGAQSWHLPLGFAALAAAGALLIAAGGVQWEVQRVQSGAARKAKTRMHQHKLRTIPAQP